MAMGADSFQKSTQPNPKPMTFTPATHARIRQIHAFTQGAVGLSAKTVGQLGKYAQNFGASLARKGEKSKREPGKGYTPGILNKSMIAFSTIADGIDQAGRTLLSSGSAAATNVVSHKYGKEAGNVAHGLAGGVKNVGLVYIDAMGVSRRAVIKSVAKGMVVGRMPNGQQLVVGSGDGEIVPAEAFEPDQKKNDYYSSDTYGGASQAGASPPGYGVESYGNAANAPPSYPSGVGEPLGSTLQGQNVREKR
jgi:spartin